MYKDRWHRARPGTRFPGRLPGHPRRRIAVAGRRLRPAERALLLAWRRQAVRQRHSRCHIRVFDVAADRDRLRHRRGLVRVRGQLAGAEVVLVDAAKPGRATAAGAGIICPWSARVADA